jgi:hypothetical protein
LCLGIKSVEFRVSSWSTISVYEHDYLSIIKIVVRGGVGPPPPLYVTNDTL